MCSFIIHKKVHIKRANTSITWYFQIEIETNGCKSVLRAFCICLSINVVVFQVNTPLAPIANAEPLSPIQVMSDVYCTYHSIRMEVSQFLKDRSKNDVLRDYVIDAQCGRDILPISIYKLNNLYKIHRYKCFKLLAIITQ